MAAIGAGPEQAAPLRAAAADLILEGLSALKKIGRTDQGQFFASPPQQGRRERPADVRSLEEMMEEDEPGRGKKKKYYN